MKKSGKLSHVNEEGAASMVDVGHKKPQSRTAKAYGKITLAEETVRLVKENDIKKGDVLTIAQIAGIQAAKLTPNLIPLCHPLDITKIDVRMTLVEDGVEAESIVKCIGKTGVEMEALTAVHIALLTVYDMCKAVDSGMIVSEIRLVEKKKLDLENVR